MPLWCRELGTHEATNYDYDKVELPSSITPMAYELDLTLRLEDHEFDGFVRIAIDIKDEDLDSITLHSKDLKISSGRARALSRCKVDFAQRCRVHSYLHLSKIAACWPSASAHQVQW